MTDANQSDAVVEGSSGLGHSVGIPNAQIQAVITLLSNFPANGRPSNREALTDAILLGFIEQAHVTKRCCECGTDQPDYSFFKITTGGRLFLEAALAYKPEPGAGGGKG